MSTAEPLAETGKDDIVKILLDNDVSPVHVPPGPPIIPNLDAIAERPHKRQRRSPPLNAGARLPAASFLTPRADLIRRVETAEDINSGDISAFFRQQGFVVGLASQAENGEYKVHVSTAFRVPSQNVGGLFEQEAPPQFGMSLNERLVDTLEMHMPGLSVTDSHRGVYATFEAPRGFSILLFGREWKVSVAPTRPSLLYVHTKRQRW